MSGLLIPCYRVIVAVCLVIAILGNSPHSQTAVATPASPGAAVSLKTDSDSAPATRSADSETIEPSGSPWIERIPAWQVVGTTLLVAFIVLLFGVVWLRWIKPGGR